MARKAEAFQLYNEAAKVDMLMKALPKVCLSIFNYLTWIKFD